MITKDDIKTYYKVRYSLISSLVRKGLESKEFSNLSEDIKNDILNDEKFLEEEFSYYQKEDYEDIVREVILNSIKNKEKKWKQLA